MLKVIFGSYSYPIWWEISIKWSPLFSFEWINLLLLAGKRFIFVSNIGSYLLGIVFSFCPSSTRWCLKMEMGSICNTNPCLFILLYKILESEMFWYPNSKGSILFSSSSRPRCNVENSDEHLQIKGSTRLLIRIRIEYWRVNYQSENILNVGQVCTWYAIFCTVPTRTHV